MAPKLAQNKVKAMRQQGMAEADTRAVLLEEGYKSSSVSQLLKVTKT